MLSEIFLGTVQLTFLVFILLFLMRIIIDALLPNKLESLLNILFFPGSFMHQTLQSLAIKACGYQVKVNYHMAFDRDYASQSIKGDLKNVIHALIIGLSPSLNYVFVVVLIYFAHDINNLSHAVNFPLGSIVRIYLLASFAFFGVPDIQDFMLPFYTVTANYSEIVILVIISLIFFIYSLGVYGWLIPTLNLISFAIVIVYLLQAGQFSPLEKNYVKGLGFTSAKQNGTERNEGEEILLLETGGETSL